MAAPQWVLLNASLDTTVELAGAVVLLFEWCVICGQHVRRALSVLHVCMCLCLFILHGVNKMYGVH